MEFHLSMYMVLSGRFSSLIAIMLGRLEMTVTECIAQYDNVMKEVFPETGDVKKAFNLATHGEFYDSTNLEKIIKNLIKDKLGDSDVDLLDEKGPCKMLVCFKLAF